LQIPVKIPLLFYRRPQKASPKDINMKVLTPQPQAGAIVPASKISKRNTVPSAIHSMNADTIRFSGFFSSGKTDNEKLLSAAAANDTQKIEKLVKRKAYINCQQVNTGKSALHISLLAGNNAAFEKLLQLKADPNIKDSLDETPMHLAAHQNNPLAIERLRLLRNGNLNSRNFQRQTPLHKAAISGHKPAVEMLIKHNADKQVKDSMNMTPYDYARKNGHEHLNQLLKPNGDNSNSNTNTSNTTTPPAPNGAATKELLKHAATGNLNGVKHALEAGAVMNEPNSAGWTPITLAARGGHDAIIGEFHARDANLLMSSDTRGYTPMTAAAMSGKKETVKLLFNLGVPINMRDGNGMTALEYAQQANHSDTIKTILELKAQEERINAARNTNNSSQTNNQHDTRGLGWNTQKLFALVTGRVQVEQPVKEIKDVIESGADVMARDVHGKQAIDYAQTEEVRIVLRQQMASENAPDPTGRTDSNNGSGSSTNPFRRSSNNNAGPSTNPFRRHTTDSQADTQNQANNQSRRASQSTQANSVPDDTESPPAVAPNGAGVVRLLTEGWHLSEMPTEWLDKLDHTTIQEVSDLLKSDIQASPRRNAAIREAIFRNYNEALPEEGQPDPQRDIRLFWNAVSEKLYGKSVKKLQSNQEVGFDAVIGMDDLKKDLNRHYIRPLNRFKNSEMLARFSPDSNQYRAFSRIKPTGLLLYGEPGTGKTHISNKLAEELDMAATEVSLTNITSPLSGESPKNLSAVFQRAKARSPHVLIFNEVDSLIPKRTDSNNQATHEKQLTNQMLIETAEAARHGVYVFASTNRLNDIDPAAKNRPERFSLTQELKLPQQQDARLLFENLLKQMLGNNLPYTAEQIQRLSGLSNGLNVDQIRQVCDNALIVAVDEDRRIPSFSTLENEINKKKNTDN
jgi:SpoVK/Ycf46/Vps4 family AAA+-type ATPase/ankyrin repeat protein